MTEAAAEDGRLVAGRYRLLDQIGRGGMGTVWRARDELLGRQVAVKRLHVSPQLDADELATRNERTRREAQAAARINHPNVVSVHDVVDDDGLPCIVMEYVRSVTLGDVVKEATLSGEPMSPAEVARIGRGMIAALQAAHSAGVLHRDVKPGNVLLGEDGRVVLTDFGIAVATGTSTLTKTGELVGSIDYLAPERVKGGTPGPASDLWALGATLYQALEGRPPFRKNTAVETAYAIAMDPLEPPRNAGPLTSLVQALLAKEPEERPSARDVEQALRGPASEPQTAVLARGTFTTVAGGAQVSERSQAQSREDPRGQTSSYEPAQSPPATGAAARPEQPASGTLPGGGPGNRTDAPLTGTDVTGTSPTSSSSPTSSTGHGTTFAPTAPLTSASASTGKPRKRRGRAAAWGAAGLVGAAAAAGGVFFALGYLDPATPDKVVANTGPASPERKPDQKAKPSPSTSASKPPPVPEGYRLVEENELGVAFPVPKGWTRKYWPDRHEIDYIDPTQRVNIKISVLDFASSDHVKHMEDLEQIVRNRDRGYERMRLQDTMFRGQPAAVWEYKFMGRVREYRVIDLGFGREGGKEYAIYVSGPSAGWQSSAEIFAKVRDGFRVEEAD
ncbi:serine/threonine-protein kinase [Streptomyces sp. MST-110588]|uniref:serine/threonine-protein kinase n=1 Tax=Streptomyces sp. MST-110588 TaxID=2833628 RepID=UPI00205C40F3|nr:serine/threonine-protein kinase [Streptomyces sp. MST-110588]UNO40339.1 protein kinase [Streptomyces sp. MST-110588]